MADRRPRLQYHSYSSDETAVGAVVILPMTMVVSDHVIQMDVPHLHHNSHSSYETATGGIVIIACHIGTAEAIEYWKRSTDITTQAVRQCR